MIASTRSVGGGAHFFSPQRIRQLRDRFRELDTSKQGRVLVKDFSELFQDVFGRQPMRDELPEVSCRVVAAALRVHTPDMCNNSVSACFTCCWSDLHCLHRCYQRHRVV